MRTRIPVSVVLVLIACWPPARATTLVRLGLEQLSQASTEIVRGRVISQESRWNQDHTQIVTFTTLEVQDAMKGHPPATVVIEQPGGTVGNIRVRVAGTALFKTQEDYVLFLEPSASPSQYLLVGMVQGCYPIVRDPMTHEEHVAVPLSNLMTGSVPDTQPARGMLRLKEFREGLAAALEAPVVIPRGAAVPVRIESVEARGSGRVRVQGRTTAEVYPSASVVIPAGSLIEGNAERVSGAWRIHWTEISIRGERAGISAISEEPAQGKLRGRTLVIDVR